MGLPASSWDSAFNSTRSRMPLSSRQDFCHVRLYSRAGKPKKSKPSGAWIRCHTHENDAHAEAQVMSKGFSQARWKRGAPGRASCEPQIRSDDSSCVRLSFSTTTPLAAASVVAAAAPAWSCIAQQRWASVVMI